MKFKKGTRRPPIEYEKDLVKIWKKNKTFEKSVEMRPKSNTYVFYDGPPFITGLPHHGTLLSSVIKDAVPRFWTMKGKRVERRWGWDCHGLPAEVYTENKLGIADKHDIGTKISLEEYIKACRDNMVQTGSEWNDTIDRIGRWVDMDNAYKTMDKPYMESVWWAFKQLHDAGKIYEGEKVLLYCTRDATPIAKAEVAMDNSYQDVTDPSVYVKFRLPEYDAYLLAWTTTPWTLPANTALAVNPKIEYVQVEVSNEQLILAKELLGKVLVDEKHQPLEYKIVKNIDGGNLVTKSYEPLFENQGQGAHKIWDANYVTTEEGTGIVHLAPAYGEDDYVFAKEKNIPLVMNTDDEGFYTSGEWKGKQIWEVNKEIAKTLHEQGKVWKIEYITHSYPHCHRCGTKLMYRAHPSWFMDIQGQKQQMLEQNGSINWFPDHIKNGRFAKTVESAPDWNISRDRFWATAMPVWKGKDKNGKEHVKVVGSYAELKELSGQELDDYHRPWIDDVTFTIDGVEYKRVDKVMDSWFEAASMPFAQFHYPFENKEKFEANFPGDFIAEYVGQVRAWFYYLHALSTGLQGKNSFVNVIVTGTIAGNDGRKMSKSYGNYTDPNVLMDQFSADALRFVYLSSPLLNGEDFALQDKDMSDISRKLSMVWNMYDFFTLYAEVDGWEWDGIIEDPTDDCENVLDKWIVSRLHQLIAEVDKHMQAYDLPNATKPIMPFIDDASNWYVRRSRKRFWKSDNGPDKQMAYKTLHYVLVQLAHVLAPFTPFMAEELYKNLTDGESVHLQDWPLPGRVNELELERMRVVRSLINEGLSQRASKGVKVRQPLGGVKKLGLPSTFKYPADIPNNPEYDALVEYNMILLQELNIKGAIHTQYVDEGDCFIELDFKLTPELKREGLAREVIRIVQAARKESGLEVDDRITLCLEAEGELAEAITAHKAEIESETLSSITGDVQSGFKKTESVDSHKLSVSLKKT